MTLAPILRVEDVLVRYGMRDARTARRLMNAVGAFKVGGRLVVREDTLGAWEAAQTNPPLRGAGARPASTGRATARAARGAAPLPSSGPDWWRPATDEALESSRSLNGEPDQ